jgi:hypothetical protein
MIANDPAHRKDVGALLESAGYELQEREFADVKATLAATPYALVACVELNDWAQMDQRVFDVQADLTELAEEVPSARSWDLYLVVMVEEAPVNPAQRALIEAIEGDTHYARKFIHAGIDVKDLDKALRPLLPLRPPADFEIADPIEELRSELLAIGVEGATVEQALGSFASEDEVELR